MSYGKEKISVPSLAKITTCLCQFSSREFRDRNLICGNTARLNLEEEKRCRQCEQFYYRHSPQKVLACSVYENIESY